MNWYVGQKVVCIDDNWAMKIIAHKELLPKRDVVYTIRDITPLNDILYFRLIEIKNTVDWYKNPISGGLIYGEICFSEKRFKPLEEDLDSIDISIFQKILDDLEQPQIVKV